MTPEDPKNSWSSAIADICKSVAGTLMGGIIVFSTTNLYLQHILAPERNIGMRPVTVYVPTNVRAGSPSKQCKLNKAEISSAVVTLMQSTNSTPLASEMDTNGTVEPDKQAELARYLTELSLQETQHIPEAIIPDHLFKTLTTGPIPLISCDTGQRYVAPPIKYEWVALMGQASNYFIDRQCELTVRLENGDSFTLPVKETSSLNDPSSPHRQFLQIDKPQAVSFEHADLTVSKEMHEKLNTMLEQLGQENPRVSLSLKCPVLIHGKEWKKVLPSELQAPLHVKPVSVLN